MLEERGKGLISRAMCLAMRNDLIVKLLGTGKIRLTCLPDGVPRMVKDGRRRESKINVRNKEERGNYLSRGKKINFLASVDMDCWREFEENG